MIISMYNPDVPFPVWDISEWWADDWSASDYSINLNLSMPFVTQLSELSNKVPRFSLMNTKSGNCEYSNMVIESKNCYLIFGCVEDENCDYGHIVWNSTDCTDNLYLNKSELCYECIDCLGSNKLLYSQECESCVDSIGLYDCRGCTNCIGCVGLRQQSYNIFNQPVSKEEYKEFLSKHPLSDEASIIYILSKREELRRKMPARAVFGSHNDNVSGDHIHNSHNVIESFDINNGENSRYCYTSRKTIETYDVSFNPDIEYSYQTLASMRSNNLISCHLVIDSNNVFYSDSCYNSKNCFGCFGLRNKEYCILNKQYTKEEYETLVPKIKQHIIDIPYIDKKGRVYRYGEFFPPELSPFAYNETVAQDYFPLNEKTVEAKGYLWREYTSGSYETTILGKDLPQIISEVDDSILDQVIECEITGKPFKITSKELKFYRRQGIPLPRRRPDQRHLDRFALRNPRKFWKRKCGKCGKEITTTWSPDRPEVVYCEECYVGEMY